MAKEPLLAPASFSKPLPVTQAQLALAPYLLEVSSPENWHGPEDYGLKDKNNSRSGIATGGRETTTSPSLPLDKLSTGGRRHLQALTLTDFAIDSHLQLQALVFLMVDRFGCKVSQ